MFGDRDFLNSTDDDPRLDSAISVGSSRAKEDDSLLGVELRATNGVRNSVWSCGTVEDVFSALLRPRPVFDSKQQVLGTLILGDRAVGVWWRVSWRYSADEHWNL